MAPSGVIDLTRDDIPPMSASSPFPKRKTAISTSSNITQRKHPITYQTPSSRKRKLKSNSQFSISDSSLSPEPAGMKGSVTHTRTPHRRNFRISPPKSNPQSFQSSVSSAISRRFRSLSIHSVESEREATPSKRPRGFVSRDTSVHNVTDLLPGSSNSDPIEIAEDQDDLASTVHNAYPVRRSGNRSSQVPDLHILRNRHLGLEDDGYGSDTFSDSSDTGLHQFVTIQDYAEDYQIPEIIRRLSEPHARPQDNDSKDARKIISYRDRGFECTKGKSVELDDNTFMRIVSVAENATGETLIRGHLLVREDSQTPTMPKRHNELVWIHPQNTDRVGHAPGTGLSEVPVKRVNKNRDIVLTNQRYPNISSRDDGTALGNADHDLKHGPLFCRWRRAVVHGFKGKILEESFDHLLYEDADGKSRRGKLGEQIFPRIADSRTRSEWRQGVTQLGGSHRATSLIHDIDNDAEISGSQKYTFGDGFCGAGGTSRGALDAGLFVKWGFDHNGQAMGSYRGNFMQGGTECHHAAVDEFLTYVSPDSILVDVLHASPPCQTFSHAKTHLTPEQDEKNEACLFSIGQLLTSAKPRVVTMEETDGLVSRHQPWFRALIHIFIHMGYSVRWKIMDMKQHGIPQIRKRLVIVAAGPGERLPAFPKPTHGDESTSLKPFVTIGDCLRRIPLHASDHNLDTVCEFAIPKLPFSPSALAKTLTCSGGVGNYHPSGQRHYTVREMASLQTFPLRHRFSGAHGMTAKKKQIGNAVPPAFARALFESIIKSLMEDDDEKLRMSRTGLVR